MNFFLLSTVNAQQLNDGNTTLWGLVGMLQLPGAKSPCHLWKTHDVANTQGTWCVQISCTGDSVLSTLAVCGQNQQVSMCVTTERYTVRFWGATAFGSVTWLQHTSAWVQHSHNLLWWEWACHDWRHAGKGLQVPGT